jgi:DNA-binding IclR family transcriptional regulator
LHVLVARSFLEFDGQQRTYVLGLRLWEAGQAYSQHLHLLREARPIMSEIVREINETVQLAKLDGIENVYLDKVDCSHPLRLQSDVGKRLFAHATGLGKAMLAYLPPDEVAHRFSGQTLPRFTANTIADIDDLLSELDDIRARGFARDNQEYTPGLRCVAVPIRDAGEQVIAAMSVSIPILRAGSASLGRALQLLAQAGLELSRRLGSTNDDQPLVSLAADFGIAHAAVVRAFDLDPAAEEPSPPPGRPAAAVTTESGQAV